MKEAMKLALEALELAHPRFGIATEKHKQAITAIKAALAQQEPCCMKMNGCKTKCEDCPVEVVEQEPVAYLCENAVGHKYFRWKKPSSTYKPIPLYTTPPQPEERNFCSRCGKRTADLTVIHTCTPPQETT